MRSSARSRGAAGALLTALTTTGALGASPLGDLPGRWSGIGSITMSNGSSEQIKCIATYFVNDGGADVQQNLRCASTSYKIDAKARLKVSNGGQVSGEWEEKTYATTGAVAGRVTGTGFALSIRGATFTAAMSVTTSSCKQSINIMPSAHEISRISVGLGKC
jgi:hypothetical protein